MLGCPPNRVNSTTLEEIAKTLAYVLRYDGRRRVHHADSAMARITAERLAEHLRRCGFVIMKGPGSPARRLAEP